MSLVGVQTLTGRLHFIQNCNNLKEFRMAFGAR